MVKHGVLAVCFSLILCGSASAGTPAFVELTCPAEASNLGVIATALRQQVLNGVDRSIYKSPRASVRFRLVARDRRVHKIALPQLVSGVSVSQSGQLATLSGGMVFSELCTYTYVVRTALAVTELATSVRLSSTTESKITISSGGEFGIKRFTSR